MSDVSCFSFVAREESVAHTRVLFTSVPIRERQRERVYVRLYIAFIRLVISILMHLSIAVIRGEFSNTKKINLCDCDCVCVCGWMIGFNPLDLGDGATEWT